MGAGLGRPGSFGDFTGKEDWQVCCSGRRDDQDEGQASDPGWHQGHVRTNSESEGNEGQDRGQVLCTQVPQRQHLRTAGFPEAMSGTTHSAVAVHGRLCIQGANTPSGGGDARVSKHALECASSECWADMYLTAWTG